MYALIYFTIQWFAILCVPALIFIYYSEFFFILFIPIVLLRLDLVRIRIRALRCFGSAPQTREEFISCIGKKPTVVGQGWHFFLKRESPKGPILFTNYYRGTYRLNDKTYWKSGTTIAEMAKYYKKRNMAFHSLPSYENISLGAWYIDRNHGSSGDTGKPSNHAFGDIDAVERDGKKYILGVEILEDKMNVNKHYEKTAFFIDSDMSEWLKPSFQRVLFIGKRTIGIVWRETNRKADKHDCCRPAMFHRDPHCCSRFCLWYQVDPLNTCCACQEPAKHYNSLVSNYEINRFVPYVATLMTVFACLHRNFEIIVNAEDFKRWNKLLEGLQSIGDGRFELRFGNKYLFVDVSLRHGFDRPFEVLRKLGFTEYALHKGKFHPKYYGMTEVNVETMFNAVQPTQSQGLYPLRLRF